MAIIVENGTGLSNAQCYCSYAQYHAVVTELGLVHSHSEEQTEPAIVSAAKRWIDGQHDFAGSKLVSTQAMKFPTDRDGLPPDIVRANALAAWYHLQGALLVDTTSIPTTGEAISIRKKLDVLETETQYQPGSAQFYSRILPADLENLLAPYLKQSTGFGRVVRLL